MSPRLGLVRFALLGAIALLYLGAVADNADPTVALVGFAPLVWLAMEAVWRLLEGDAARTTPAASGNEPQAEPAGGDERLGPR